MVVGRHEDDYRDDKSRLVALYQHWIKSRSLRQCKALKDIHLSDIQPVQDNCMMMPQLLNRMLDHLELRVRHLFRRNVSHSAALVKIIDHQFDLQTSLMIEIWDLIRRIQS